MVDEEEIEELVDGRPDLADGLEAVLSVDEETDGWTFDDVPVETGVFGEIVGYDIVEECETGYRVSDPTAVRRALRDETGSPSESAVEPSESYSDILRSIADRELGIRTGIAAIVVLLFIAARAIAYPQVFRDRGVVLSGNDPYFYRYWVDRLLAESSNPLSVGVIRDIDGMGEPLLVASIWWLTTFLGGTREVAGHMLAWYPVVAALCIGGLVYFVGTYVLGDRRVGVLAAVILAIMPIHAMRTGLGFADHHAFDYVWLMAVIAGMAWLATTEDESLERPSRRGTLGLGIAITGLIMAWNGSPLMLFPVAAYLGVKVPLDVFANRSPVRSNAAVLLGLAIAAVLSLGVHLALGWQSLVLAAVPLLLASGGAILAGSSGLLGRRGVTARQLVGLKVAVAALGLVLFSLAVKGAFETFASGVRFVLGTGGIGETESAFRLSDLVGVKQFGVAVLLALPVLVRGSWRALNGDDRWLVLCVFGWYFLALSAVQLRFGGQLAPLAALFAAVGILWILARYELVAEPVPFSSTRRPKADDTQKTGSDGGIRSFVGEFHTDRLEIRSGLVVLLLVLSLAGTSGAYLPEKVTATAVEDRNYETTSFMADHAAAQGWEYPENYVFSRWGYNRMFNYPVNGNADSYQFARQNYPGFISSDAPGQWYERLQDRVGFIVIEPIPPRPGTIQQHFYETYGSRWDNYESVSHYRAVFTDEKNRNKVFVLVPGANVVGSAPPNATAELRTTVEIPNDEFLYRQQAEVNESGQFRAVVPYPGTYEVRIGNQTHNVTVPDGAVSNNMTVDVDS